MQRDDKKFKFMIPGGSSVKLLIEKHLDTPYDYEALAKAGSLLGSGGLMVFDETVSVPALMGRLSHFYAHRVRAASVRRAARARTGW